MPNNDNISEEDYLDSLLRAVSAGKDNFDIDEELDIDADFDEQFEAEFEAELKAEFGEPSNVEIKGKQTKNTMAKSNSVFTADDDELSEEDRALSAEIKNSVLASVDPNVDETDSLFDTSWRNSFEGPLKRYELGNENDETESSAETPFAEGETVAEATPFVDEASLEVETPINEVTSKDETPVNEESLEEPVQSESSEEDDITNQLAAMLGVGTEKENKKNTPSKEEIQAAKEKAKLEKERIKANKKAAKEASKIAKKAEKAKKAEEKERAKELSKLKNQKEENLVDSMADIFDSADNEMREAYKENTSRGLSAEEKSIDDSVDATLADLGLDALFSQIGQRIDEPAESVSPFATEEADNSLFDEIAEAKEAEEKEKKKKEKKEKKQKAPKKKKEKKPKPPKKKKPPKVKKPKKQDEIVPISVPFLIFGLSLAFLLVVAVTISGNLFDYNTHMDKAVNYYVNKNYHAAYREISGLKIKEKDKYFYEQVNVVMKVESNYDMFKSMMKIGEYDAGLDYLLKGVDNFDLYQNDAREWEAFDDLEISLRKIVGSLETYYGITESQAREINLIESQLEYSIKVSELAEGVKYDPDIPFADETTTAPETTTGENEEDTSVSEEKTTVEAN